MKGFTHRLQRLEQKYLTCDERRVEIKIAGERLMKGAVAGLTDAEMQHIVEFSDMQAADPDARPNAAQQAALDAYVRHYRDFLTAGRLRTIRGCPVDYSGRWPEVNGCSVGLHLGASWWVEGIGYCLDVSPRNDQKWQILAVNGRL